MNMKICIIVCREMTISNQLGLDYVLDELKWKSAGSGKFRQSPPNWIFILLSAECTTLLQRIHNKVIIHFFISLCYYNNQCDKIMENFKYDYSFTLYVKKPEVTRGGILRDIIADVYYAELADGNGEPIHFIRYKPSGDNKYHISIRLDDRVVLFVQVYMYEVLDMYNCGVASILGYMIKLGLAKILRRFRYTLSDKQSVDMDALRLLGYRFVNVMHSLDSSLRGGSPTNVFLDDDVNRLAPYILRLANSFYPKPTPLYRCAIAVSLYAINDKISNTFEYRCYGLDFDDVFLNLEKFFSVIDDLNRLVCGGGGNGQSSD